MLKRTQLLAKRLYQKIGSIIDKKAIIIALEGPLGAGKTTFTKAFAQAMGIKEIVLSPTFTLHSEYGQLDHIDLWRIEDPQEVIDLGLDKMIAAKKVIIIEWAEKVKETLRLYQNKAQIIWVKFEYGDKDKERIISWKIL